MSQIDIGHFTDGIAILCPGACVRYLKDLPCCSTGNVFQFHFDVVVESASRVIPSRPEAKFRDLHVFDVGFSCLNVDISSDGRLVAVGGRSSRLRIWNFKTYEEYRNLEERGGFNGGLCFSPDLKRLYVADTGASHYLEAERIIWVFDVAESSLRNPREFVSMELEGRTGSADGITSDEDGNIWASAGWVGEGYDGVHVFAPSGERIGMIKLPEICSNVCFGGSRGNRLFMTASQSVYSVFVNTRAAHTLGT